MYLVGFVNIIHVHSSYTMIQKDNTIIHNTSGGKSLVKLMVKVLLGLKFIYYCTAFMLLYGTGATLR